MDALQQRGIEFKSLQENIDTNSSGGRLVFNIFASLAEFERDLIRERTNAGLAAARARGRTGGRPAIPIPRQIAHRQKTLRAARHDGGADRRSARRQPQHRLPRTK